MQQVIRFASRSSSYIQGMENGAAVGIRRYCSINELSSILNNVLKKKKFGKVEKLEKFAEKICCVSHNQNKLFRPNPNGQVYN